MTTTETRTGSWCRRCGDHLTLTLSDRRPANGYGISFCDFDMKLSHVPTDVRPQMRCRCGLPLERRPEDTSWVDFGGYSSCKATGESHKPVTDCTVVDQILTWTDKHHTPLVGVGDLVLENGELASVTRIRWNPATLRVKVWLSCYETAFEVSPGAYVAVRRYAETSSQDTEEKSDA